MIDLTDQPLAVNAIWDRLLDLSEARQRGPCPCLVVTRP